MTDHTRPKVFVGLSGGVDSSVAAARLVDAGYDVTGVFIKVWHPDWMVCNWERERLDAMRVAAHLGIPFLTCDAVDAYRDEVAMYFIDSYKAGKTPNPDVLCNQHVKFGRFLEFAIEHGADFVATGHYARKIGEGNDAELWRGVDSNKDQTYFLWSLNNTQLATALFPIGDTPKEQIRVEAEERGIPVAQKKDSQGICFLGHVDIAEFLSHYVELVPGDVLSTTGERIGTHHGALIYTLGQRHGFTLDTTDVTRTPHYVIEKRLEDHQIVVDIEPPKLEGDKSLSLGNVILRQPIAVGDTLEAQFRYRQTPITVTVTSTLPLTLNVTEDSDRPAAGQSCVLYRGEHCLGGGIIQ